MTHIPTRETFESLYAGNAPWDIGRPQSVYVDIADLVTGSVLDAGCGTGEIALYFAARGCQVTGIDFLEEPIRRAKQKGAERGLSARFLVMSALDLADMRSRFDNVIDSGLFHVFCDLDRQRYVAGLTSVLKPSGRVFLTCLSEEEPGVQGPRRVTQQELRDAFRDEWTIEEIRPTRFEIAPGSKDLAFSEGGARAWFAVIRRQDTPSAGRSV